MFQNYDIEGVLGLSWAFGIPTFDIIHGTGIDLCTVYVRVWWNSC